MNYLINEKSLINKIKKAGFKLNKDNEIKERDLYSYLMMHDNDFQCSLFDFLNECVDNDFKYEEPDLKIAFKNESNKHLYYNKYNKLVEASYCLFKVSVEEIKEKKIDLDQAVDCLDFDEYYLLSSDALTDWMYEQEDYTLGFLFDYIYESNRHGDYMDIQVLQSYRKLKYGDSCA